MARVTVCIPTYNRSGLLRETVESVLAQTFPDFVIDIADNCSDDDTAELVASFGDPRIRYLRNPVNVGVVANFNILAHRADTEYVLFLCDDDLLRPELLEDTVAVLDAYPSAGLVHTAFDLVDGEGHVTETTNWTCGLTGDTLESSTTFLIESMRWSCRVCQSTTLIRRSAMPEERFDPAAAPAIDFELWLEMAAAGWDVAYLARPLGAYRIHAASQSALAIGVIDSEEHGYAFDPSAIDRLHRQKLAFIERHAGTLPGVPVLRKLALRCAQREKLWGVEQATLAREQPFRRARFLVGAVRVDPSSLVSEATWRALAADILRGHRRVVPPTDDPAGGALAR